MENRGAFFTPRTIKSPWWSGTIAGSCQFNNFLGESGVLMRGGVDIRHNLTILIPNIWELNLFILIILFISN